MKESGPPPQVREFGAGMNLPVTTVAGVPEPGPLDHAFVAIRTARPGLTVRARAVVEAILLSKGPIGAAEHVAHALGLKNRFRLARLLHNEGLPPLHRLAEWLTIFSWVSRAQREGVSLCWMAFRMNRDPSACYRLVKQLTGLGWEELQARGEAWVLDQFLKELDRVGSLARHSIPRETRVARQGRGKRI